MTASDSIPARRTLPLKVAREKKTSETHALGGFSSKGPVNPNILIDAVLQSYLAVLDAELAKARSAMAARRIYDAGQVLEDGLAALLIQLLPHHVGITRGHVASHDWKSLSGEIDIILYDKRVFPGFPYVETHRARGLSVISVCAVLGCLSVKATLTEKELISAMKSLAGLPTDSQHRFFQGIVGEKIPAAVKIESRETKLGHVQFQPLDKFVSENAPLQTSVDCIYSKDGAVVHAGIQTPDGVRVPKGNEGIGLPKDFATLTINEGIASAGGSGPGQAMLFLEDGRGNKLGRTHALKVFLIELMRAVHSGAGHPPNLDSLVPPLGNPDRKIQSIVNWAVLGPT